MTRVRIVMILSMLGWVGGCGAETEPSGHLEPALAAPLEGTSQPVAAAEDEPETEAAEGDEAGTYGEAPDSEMPLTPLAAILAEPAAFRDQVVRTEGQIAQVCQRMGCWMELREGEDGPAVRVPMAGHGFFLPRTASGRQAMMQGRVAMRELTPAARAHLESEGAEETHSALSIAATGVVIN
ncbi:MAG: DUF4920 domain-containing protein [Sandaracinaceae bacterium]